jgi:hypothetical protein
MQQVRNGVRLAAVMGIVTMSGLLTAFPAGAGGKAATDLNLNGTDYTSHPDDYRFHGDVSSTKAKCEKGRRIKLYMKMDGENLLVGYTFSDSEGNWSLQVDKDKYEAIGNSAVNFAKTPKTGACAADRSEVLIWS